MNEKISVSVIVPAYNCAKYLDELFDCLLNQTLENIEIIIVDNASTDSTVEKVNQYSEKDTRVILLSQPSPGAGLARNTGLEKARGKYVAFLDADDLYDKTMLEKLFLCMEKANADIGVCSVLKIDYINNTKKFHSAFSKSESIEENRVYSFKDFNNIFSAFDVSPQNKMFLRRFIVSNKFRFSSTKTANDLFFTEATRISTKKIAFITEDLVTIRRNFNSDSLSSTRIRSSEDIVTVLKELYAYMKEIRLEKELFDSFLNFSCKHIKYGAQRGINEDFYCAVTEWFKEEPWTMVSKEDFYKKLNFCKFHSELVKERLNNEISQAASPEEKAALCSKLKERENQEVAMNTFIDAFFGNDKDLIEKCEALQIKTEFEKSYMNAAKLYETKKQNKALNKKLTKELKDIKSSFSYRLGRFLTFIPRKIKSVLKK